jgi:hypothetical protein
VTWQRKTALFILFIVVLCLGYDGVAFYKGGISATISDLIYTKSYQIPAIPLAFGMLMGHFFL